MVQEHAGNPSKDLFLRQRRGVFAINDFYNTLLDTSYNYEQLTRDSACVTNGMGSETDIELQEVFWAFADEAKLATALNGEVFADEQEIFSTVRAALLSYYPEKIWRRKLAQGLHEFSQYAQSNYPRMMARKDYITATLCVAKALESAMNLVYLLKKEYAPYYKWKKKGLQRLIENQK